MHGSLGPCTSFKQHPLVPSSSLYGAEEVEVLLEHPRERGQYGTEPNQGSFVQRQCQRAEWIKVHQNVPPPSNSSFGHKQEAEVFCHPKSLRNVPAFIAAFIYLFLPFIGTGEFAADGKQGRCWLLKSKPPKYLRCLSLEKPNSPPKGGEQRQKMG